MDVDIDGEEEMESRGKSTLVSWLRNADRARHVLSDGGDFRLDVYSLSVRRLLGYYLYGEFYGTYVQPGEVCVFIEFLRKPWREGR